MKHINTNKVKGARTTVVGAGKKHGKRVAKATRKAGAVGLIAGKHAAHHTKKVAKKSYKFTHHHVAAKPHVYLVSRVAWYRNWHEWRWHKRTHYAILSGYLLVVAAVMIGIFRIALAADLIDTWNFSVPGDYSLSDSSAVEVSGNTARLKAQNYTTDGNTKGLYHLDDGSGSTLTDSSGNSNNAAATGSPSWGTGNLNGALALNGTSQFAAAPDSASLSLTGNNTLESWVKFANPFSAGSSQYRQTILDKGKYQLYYDNETGKVTYELENSGSTGWTQQAGYDMIANNGAKVNRSWDQNGKQTPFATVKMGSDIYTALGGSTNDAEIWKYDTGSGIWSQIAGDGINSSWNNDITTGAYEAVLSLATDGTDTLYAGLGSSTNDGDVWRFEGGSWSKIGGDGLNSGWPGSSFTGVYSLAVNGDTVYAGLGNGGNMAQVWVCTSCETSPNWNSSRLGGFNGTARGWGAGYEVAWSMTLVGGNPIVGLGSGAGDAEVWRCTASCTSPGSATWVKLGGDGSGSGGQSWGSAAEYVLSLASNGNTIYVGTGITANADTEVWSCDVTVSCTPTGTGWTRLGNSATFGSTKLGVYSITNNGSTLYVGVGGSTGDDEVWRYDGAWTKVGGDTLNSGWNNSHQYARSLLVDGTTVYAGLMGTDNYTWRCTSCNTSPNWGGARIGGRYVNKSWGQYGFDSIQSSSTAGGKLYVGTGSDTAGEATVWEQDPSSGNWSVVGGQGINSSWPADTYEAVLSMTNYKNKLYVGLGSSTNDAEVWRFDNPGWTKVGGDAVGSSWNASIEYATSLGVAGGKLYAGIGGNSTLDGEVWECSGCDGGSPAWTQIGGTASGNWNINLISNVRSIATYRGLLYVGLGGGTGYAEIWRYSGSGTTWTKVGGDAINSSWADARYEEASNLVVWNDKLVASLGSTGSGTPNNDAEVWACTGCDGGSPSWSHIGGDSNGSDNKGWLDANNYDRATSLAVYNGDLYVGLGLTAGDGEVWRYNGTTWTQIAGDGLNSSWPDNTIEDITGMVVHRGKLYVGMGMSGNSDAMVWSYGDNGYLQSSTTSQDTAWHHVAARYNGTTMELLIDGASVGTATKTLAMSDGPQDLLIGKSHGGFDNGRSQGFFEGSLDEIRVSDVNRSSITTKPYTQTQQTARLANATRISGVLGWEGFSSSETPNGGTIKYRLSDDGGTTWKYWTGSTWAASSNLSEANLVSVINSNISTFPVTFGGIVWQAVLTSDGNQQVTLNSVTLSSNSDIVEPSANASSIQAYKSNGGASLASNAWTNGSSPYFTWTAGTDAGSGIKGYCLYLGTDSNADPVSTKGLLGTSPVNTGGHCQFLVSAANFDTASNLATALTTSNSPYYLRIKAMDNAGNVYSAGTEQFQFRFDNTPPSNPGYITAPSGFINTKTATLSWPTSGGQAPADSNSGLAGLQYKVNNTTWYGDSHTGFGDINDVLANDGSYTTVDPPDFANLSDGINTVYFRTWDAAGNVTSIYSTAALKINANGAPSEPQNVQASPASNTTNAFSFSWDPPLNHVGDASDLSYCYTINTLPSESTCTFTATGVTSLGSGPYATQPGVNTIYVAARDESPSINYASYSTATFTANTPSPGIPVNADIVDVSIKSTGNWRLALTWDQPSYVGAGISNYKVYRSINNSTFTFVGSSSSTTYIDASLSQQTYYYRVRACDSTNNCGADSATVSMLPTGKFTTPATLTSEPEVSNVTTKKARISWTTDRGSDSKVAIGTQSGQYSPSEVGNSTQTAAHVINLDNLAAGTTYYYKVKWTDEDGNTGTSQEYSFTTSPAPLLKEVVTLKSTLSGAVIQFSTKQAVKANLYYGKTDGFGGLKTVNTSISESTYSVELAGLEDGSKYYYVIGLFDEEGNEYKGSIFSFTTPPRPKITNLRFQPVSGEPTSTQEVTWITNVPTTSAVAYGKTNSAGTDVQVSQLVTEHKITIKNLEDDSEYFLIASGRDADGNLSNSDRQQFKTALDTRPPKVKDIMVEPSIRGSGAEARGQVVVSWKTDEPSTSQVAYAEGSGATVFNNKTAEDAQLTTEHIVIVSDLPTSRVYSIQPVSKDKAGNGGTGEVQSAIIGRASDSVLTIILNTLKRVFGV